MNESPEVIMQVRVGVDLLRLGRVHDANSLDNKHFRILGCNCESHEFGRYERQISEIPAAMLETADSSESPD